MADKQVLTIAGYILGFPADTPESIERDIETIQHELPIDILEFFMLTPLPGSADHQALYRRGRVDGPGHEQLRRSSTSTTAHPRMTADEWRGIYDRAWHLYYSPEHVETLLRRARAARHPFEAAYLVGLALLRQLSLREGPSAAMRHVSPQGAHDAAAVFQRENPLPFYPKRLWEMVRTYGSMAWFGWQLRRLRLRIEREPGSEAYLDEALDRSKHILPLPVLQPETPVAAAPAEPQIIPLVIRKAA